LKLVQTRRRRALAARTKARSNEVRRATLAVHAETRPAKVRTELPRDRDTAGHWRQLSGTLVSASARLFTILRLAMAVPHNVMTLLDINPAWQEAVVGNLILGAPGPSPRLGLSSGPRWTARPLWTAWQLLTASQLAAKSGAP
jgi:hypothetical protein